jgi:ABC-type lipoprotein release transport system permease subunit
MKNQKGSVALIVLGLFVGVLVAIAGAVFMMYVSAYNYGNSAENGLEATYTNNQNILAQYGQKIQEAAQIPAMQRDDVAKVLMGAVGARYGKNGSQASMQWIHEQNPSLSPKLYEKLQQLIEAGRDEFKNSQTELIDKKRSYSTELGSFLRGTFLHMAGYPKKPLSDYKIITTDYADESFKVGKETGPMKLR